MTKNLPLVAAITLAALWAALILAVPVVMSLFSGFKVEMPALTMALLSVVHFMYGAGLLILVLVSAILLASRQQAGWILSVLLCLAWNVALLALVMPYIALMNTISATAGPATTASLNPAYSLVVLLIFSLNQLLLVALVARRREFVLPPLVPYAPISNP